MEAIKASMHAGRTGNPIHNDRTYDYSKDAHIDAEKVKNNIHMSYKNLSFKEAEKEFYSDHYKKSMMRKNKRYRKNGQRTKCKTIGSMLTGRNSRPEEVILQIGDMREHPDDETFKACVNDFMEKLKEFSSNYHVIDIAVHLDESTPHAHIRGVYDYTDEHGDISIGQEKALKELGIPLPDPSAPEGRNNNRKMVFHRELRETWYDICETRGIKIDRAPDIKNQEHYRIPELVIKRQQEEIERQQQEIASLSAELSRYKEEVEQVMEILKDAEEELAEKEGKRKARKLLAAAGVTDILADLGEDRNRTL